MLRKLCFLASLTAAMLASSAAQADVFFSGTFDANGSVAGGANVNNASSMNLAAGGISYNNVFGTGAGGSSVVGNTIVAVGFVPLTGANVATNTNISFGLANNNLVAVYAFQGTVTAPPIAAAANFQVESGNKGVIIIMDRSAVAGAGLTITDPSTWVNNINNLSNGQVARLSLNNLPTDFPFYTAGAPGPLTTENPNVVNPANINTANTLFNATVQSSPEFKLQIDNFGTFLSDPQVQAPPGWTLQDYALYLLINQQVPVQSTVPADIADLNLIATALLAGQQFATGIGAAGSQYNNDLTSGSGDLALNNTGGRAIFGAQFNSPSEEVPEPASIIVWAGLSLVGGAVGLRRKLKAKQNA